MIAVFATDSKGKVDELTPPLEKTRIDIEPEGNHNDDKDGSQKPETTHIGMYGAAANEGLQHDLILFFFRCLFLVIAAQPYYKPDNATNADSHEQPCDNIRHGYFLSTIMLRVADGRLTRRPSSASDMMI